MPVQVIIQYKVEAQSTDRGAPAGLPEEDEEDQYPGQHDSGQ